MREDLLRELAKKLKPFVYVLLIFALGFGACWSMIRWFEVKPSSYGFFYYHGAHPYDKKLNEREMDQLDSLTVVFRQILFHLRTSYYKEVSLEEIANDMFKRRNKVLDSHSYYLTFKESWARQEILLDKGFGGIGVSMVEAAVDSVNKQKTKVVVYLVFPNTSAAQAGVTKGDTIVSVNDQNVFSSEQAKNLIRGKIGTKVLLKIIRKDNKDTLRMDIERKKVIIPSVTWNLLDKNKSIGLIKILSFSRYEPLNLQLAIISLKGMGIKKIVLDLRDNGGGFVDSFLHSSLFFMPESDTIAVFAAKGSKEVYDSSYVAKEFGAKNIGKFKNLEVVCLINNNTGSAAEFLAKTLQRWGYKLVGEPTIGHSTTVRSFKLRDGSEVNISTKKAYFGGQEEEIPETGVKPDFLVQNPTDSSEDLQLKKAIEILQERGDK